MASFHTKTFKKHDDYTTPKSAWEAISHFIPKDKIIWEGFFCKENPVSGKYLEELGFKVIHKNIDFFKHNEGDIVISNPPFSIKKETLTYLKKIDKPFILLMPSSTLNTQYIRNLFTEQEIKIIIPRKRIQFIKIIDGKALNTNKCNFDCFYFCYKIDNVKNQINWLK